MLKTRHIIAASAAMITAAALGAMAVSSPAHHNPVDEWQIKAVAYQNNDYTVSAQTQHLVAALDSQDWVQSLTTVEYKHHQAAKFIKSEQICLAQAVYYEARSETRSGQMAVAEVVRNRVKSRHYPNSICGVVYQGSGRKTGCQFSFTCDGSMDKAPKGKYWEQSLEVATLMQTHDVKPLTHGATHYHTTAINPKWSSNLRYIRQIGTHKFYKFKFTERSVVNAPSSLAIAPPI